VGRRRSPQTGQKKQDSQKKKPRIRLAFVKEFPTLVAPPKEREREGRTPTAQKETRARTEQPVENTLASSKQARTLKQKREEKKRGEKGSGQGARKGRKKESF